MDNAGHEEAHVAAHGYEFPTAKDWAAEDKQHPTMANWHNIHEWYQRTRACAHTLTRM